MAYLISQSDRLFSGSSPFSREHVLYLQEEVFSIPIPVGDSLYHLYSVVNAFELAGVEPVLRRSEDASKVG